jgi:hypothetical protein
MTLVLYDAIVSIVEYYLGPASERFVNRQIQSHLNKDPQDIDREDLPQLIEWIQVSMGLLTEDRAAVDECSHKLTQLV